MTKINPDLHVVITRLDLSDEYSQHTAATIASVLENTTSHTIIHIIHEERISFKQKEKTEEAIAKYQKLVNNYDAELIIHNIQIPTEFYTNQSLQNIPSLIIYRFFIHEIVKDDIDWLISLGSDVIVNTDLAKIIDTLPNEYTLAGSLDQGFGIFSSRKKVKKFYKNIDFTPKNYINIDVTFINIRKLRETKILPNQALEFLKEHPNTPMWEQDILNYLFQNDIYILPQRYNTIASFETEKIVETLGDSDDYILHYAGPNKPWLEYHGKYDMEYWYYLSLTPWGEHGEFFRALINTTNSPEEVILNIDRWICHLHSYREIIKTLWNLTFPTYINLAKSHIRSKKKIKQIVKR